MFKPMILRAFNSYDTDKASDEAGVGDFGPSLTVQDEKDEADINTIVRRFGLTGQLPENVHPPTFGDFTDVVDFRTAMSAVAVAKESFEAMPADVRSRFGNDPQAFVEFCSDAKNIDEMRKMGLAVPKDESTMLVTPPISAG